MYIANSMATTKFYLENITDILTEDRKQNHECSRSENIKELKNMCDE